MTITFLLRSPRMLSIGCKNMEIWESRKQTFHYLIFSGMYSSCFQIYMSKTGFLFDLFYQTKARSCLPLSLTHCYWDFNYVKNANYLIITSTLWWQIPTPTHCYRPLTAGRSSLSLSTNKVELWSVDWVETLKKVKESNPRSIVPIAMLLWKRPRWSFVRVRPHSHTGIGAAWES